MPLLFQTRDGYLLALRPERPAWAAVNEPGRLVLERLHGGDDRADIISRLSADSGLLHEQTEVLLDHFARETKHLWDGGAQEPYAGRGAYLRPGELRELWLHVNQRCNFSCRHCLVSSGPAGSDGLPTGDLLRVIREAHDLGVETFLVTGGEPLLRDDLPELIAAMLERPGVHVAVLTNGSLLTNGFLTAPGTLDRDRLHLQISLDASTPEQNDRLRSPGAFASATEGIRAAVDARLDVTVATVVLDENLSDLPHLVRVLADLGVAKHHLMWQHVRERGAREAQARLDRLVASVIELKAIAHGAGVTLDNFENARSLAHGTAGVKRDLSNACWDSLAVHMDGHTYPSAALVGIDEVRGLDVRDAGLKGAWLDSPAFEAYRRRSLGDAPHDDDPFRFLHGGGDPEHAYFHGLLGGNGTGDPYIPLYCALMLQTIDEAACANRRAMRIRDDLPVAYARMGHEGPVCAVHTGVLNGGAHQVAFTHSNCVLMEDVLDASRRLVQDYYGDAATRPKSEICCPVQGSASDLAHIPPKLMERTYGCGSPVFAAGIQSGETVVDLGSGVGVECFAAAKLVGPEGRVIGVDMTPDMLSVSRGTCAEVAENLGYANVEFREGFLEDIPLDDDTADAVISNCVINLSPEKLRVFNQVHRILKPGGRMVISDIVSDGEVPGSIKHNPQLKSECIGGALAEDDLLFMLSKLGFTDIRVMHHVRWRMVEGVQFYSDTIHATKAVEPTLAQYLVDTTPDDTDTERHMKGCITCGAPLVYTQDAVEAECHLCGRRLTTRAMCEAGHFVCDQCHGGDYLRFVQSYAAQCDETDPVRVFLDMRAGFPFPMHGPEHHALVPAAFLIAYRNSGGEVSPHAIESAIDQGGELPGGTCAYWGGCSAALGIGVAYATILEATPVKSRGRKYSQAVVGRIISRMGEFLAPRCCRRESLLALEIAAEMSADFLPTTVETSADASCDQVDTNETCVRGICPYGPVRS